MPRDFSKPYTTAELDGLREAFRKLPSYQPGGWITTKDIPALIEVMQYPRTPEQVAAYQEHWDKTSGGIITMEHFIKSACSLYSLTQFSRDYAANLMDGKNELTHNQIAELLALMKTHEARLAGKTVDDVINEFGRREKLTLEEWTSWFEKNAPS